MKSNIKKICLLTSGWGFIALGVAGLFLPILQGVLFLLIGLVILSSEYVWAHKVLGRLRVHFPRFTERSAEASKKVAHWFSELGGSARTHHASDTAKVVGRSPSEPDARWRISNAGFHPIAPGSGVASTEIDDPYLPTCRQRPLAGAVTPHKFKIMVAVRDSDHIDNLMKVACQLSNSSEAEVAALYVVEIGPGLPLDLEFPMLEEPGRMVLARAYKAASQYERKITTHLIRAHQAGEAIVHQAKAEGVDFIIMGYRSKRGLSEILLGSTFRHVIEHASCQVIVEVLPQGVRYPK